MSVQAPSRVANRVTHQLGRRTGARNAAGLVLALILTSQLMVVLDATIVNIALHDIRSALGFSAAGLSWVVNAYTLTFGGLLLLGARAGDILGRRRVFLVGIGLFTLASLVGGFAQNPAELLIARAVQGVGGALASPSALALLMTMFAQGRERTRAIGLYTAVSIGGAAVGLIAGGMLTEWASWRWVLFVNVPIGAALLVLGRTVLPETERNHGRFDLAGALTSTIGMTALVYGFVHAATDGWTDVATIASFAVGLVLLAAFVVIEMRAESPITPLRLFASRNRTSAYIARLLLVAGMMGMFFFLTQFLRGVLGYSDLRTGFAFLPLTALVFTASQLSARFLVDRFGDQRVDDHRDHVLDARHAAADADVRVEQLPRPGRCAGGLRTRQRPRVRAAHDRRAGRCRAAGRRRRIGAGQRHAAGRRIARPRGAGHRLRHREPERRSSTSTRACPARQPPGTCSSRPPTPRSGRRRLPRRDLAAGHVRDPHAQAGAVPELELEAATA